MSRNTSTPFATLLISAMLNLALPAQNSEPAISNLSLEEAQAFSTKLRKEISEIEARLPSVGQKDVFEKTIDYEARKAAARAALDKSTEHLRKAIEQIESEMYVVKASKLTFKSYDADFEKLTLAMEPNGYLIILVEPTLARRMVGSLDKLMFVARFMYSVGSGCRSLEFARILFDKKSFATQCVDEQPAYRIGGGVSAPAVLVKVEPEFSEEARKARFEGAVMLYLEVDETGKAKNLRVTRPLGLGLDEKAIEAVSQWKFRPGYKDGKAVTVAATVEVNFRFVH